MKNAFTMVMLLSGFTSQVFAEDAATKRVLCVNHVDGKMAKGSVELNGLEGTGTLTDGSKVKVEIKNQCSTTCILQKIITIEILGTTLTAKNTFSYNGDSGTGTTEYPIISGKINGVNFDAYCADY